MAKVLGLPVKLHLAAERGQAGAVHVRNELDITTFKDNELARLSQALAFVLQRFHPLPAPSVSDKVGAPVLPYRVALFDSVFNPMLVR
jgi:ABC-type ATPase involved in cell division